MARPRNISKKDLPRNLYWHKAAKQYVYTHPHSKKDHYIGKDKSKAVATAIECNTRLLGAVNHAQNILGYSITMSNWIARYQTEILPSKNLAQKTLTDYNAMLRTISEVFGEKNINDITLREIADFLDRFKPRYSNYMRSLLMNLFSEAAPKGYCDDNPVSLTKPKKITKSRKRLDLESLKAIIDAAPSWLKIAIYLALHTLQRPHDLLNIKYEDIKDGFLYVIQSKTEKYGASAHLKIKITQQLQQLIDSSKDGVESPYVIHRTPKSKRIRKNTDHYTMIAKDYLTRTFSALRDELGLYQDLEPNERPTFYEIRSLGIKLYENNPLVDEQKLAGHTTSKMTDHYKKGYDDWTVIEHLGHEIAEDKNN